jgi:hypothetical protein
MAVGVAFAFIPLRQLLKKDPKPGSEGMCSAANFAGVGLFID